CSHCAFANVLTYFSAKGVSTIQSLLTLTIFRFLGWETLRDQVSTLGTHDPGAVSFAEAALRDLSPSVVPWKNISGMILGVFADHSRNARGRLALISIRFFGLVGRGGKLRFYWFRKKGN